MIRGQYIKKVREELNISRRELAKKANISHTEVFRIENGERKEPSPIILKVISKSLGINYLELFYQYGYIDKELLEGVVIREHQKKLEDYSTKELLEELLKREMKQKENTT